MEANVIPLKKQTKPESDWEKAIDSKGRPVPYLFLNRSSKTYHVWKNFKALGIKSLRESTREKTLSRARTAAEVIIQRHKNKCLGIDDSGILIRKKGTSFREAAHIALEKETPEKRIRTQEKDALIIPSLVAKWGDYQLDEIYPKDFSDWLTALKTKKRKCTQSYEKCRSGKCKHQPRPTFMDYAKVMNFVMRIAHERKLVRALVKFDNPDEVGETGRVFGKNEISAMWKVMGVDTRDQFVLCYESMMRLREALYLTWDRVDLKTGEVILRKEDVKTGSKTGRGRNFIMSRNSLTRMRERFEKYKHLGSNYVFPGREKISKRWNIGKPQHDNDSAWVRVKRAAGIQGQARWHDLRHTAISEALLVHNLPIVKVSDYCGTSVGTLQRVYLHSKAEQTKEIAARIDGLGDYA